ncbi:hypothetical protein ACFOW6_00585 [Fodinicurvata halophila]|uniref:Cell division protein FtsL n=1 Tax=Fodinicurvata halophila TaxID=1419723 RepID=A0ABV8UHR9_9PROT
MNRIFFVFMMLAAVVAMAALFQVKHEVQQQERRLKALNEQILRDQEAIHILKAEWSYLNDPERLARLAERHLDFQPMETEQVSQVAYLPPRPEDFGYSQAETAGQKPYPPSRPKMPENWSPDPLPEKRSSELRQASAAQSNPDTQAETGTRSDVQTASVGGDEQQRHESASRSESSSRGSEPVNPVTGRPLPTAGPTFVSLEASQ